MPGTGHPATAPAGSSVSMHCRAFALGIASMAPEEFSTSTTTRTPPREAVLLPPPATTIGCHGRRLRRVLLPRAPPPPTGGPPSDHGRSGSALPDPSPGSG